MGREDLVEDEGLASNRGRVSRRDDINQALSAWFAEHTVEESVRLAAESGVAVSPVNTFADAARMPHVIEREMLQEIELEDGSVAPIVGPAAKFSRTPTKIRSAAAALGAHTQEILSEIGYTPEEIDEFEQKNIV
jgi:formyl-CoA transferase